MAICNRQRVIDLQELIPDDGDMVTIVNCGTHIEVVTQKIDFHALSLTDDELHRIRSGQMCWH